VPLWPTHGRHRSARPHERVGRHPQPDRGRPARRRARPGHRRDHRPRHHERARRGHRRRCRGRRRARSRHRVLGRIRWGEPSRPRLLGGSAGRGAASGASAPERLTVPQGGADGSEAAGPRLSARVRTGPGHRRRWPHREAPRGAGHGRGGHRPGREDGVRPVHLRRRPRRRAEARAAPVGCTRADRTGRWRLRAGPPRHVEGPGVGARRVDRGDGRGGDGRPRGGSSRSRRGPARSVPGAGGAARRGNHGPETTEPRQFEALLAAAGRG
jgi:hypothetical protein